MRTTLVVAMFAVLVACNNGNDSTALGVTERAAPEPAANPASQPVQAPRPKPDNAKTVADVALGSSDHTTLVAALKSADLVTALDSPGGIYTVFAPTNEAFAKLPPGTVDGLMKPDKKEELKLVLQHHVTVPVLAEKDLHDGQVLKMADGTKVTVHVNGGKVMLDDAHIVGAPVSALNGVVYVIDKVLLPPPK
jgi:uncharacterized surface protein with fasciclin (FAS1) repeats